MKSINDQIRELQLIKEQIEAEVAEVAATASAILDKAITEAQAATVTAIAILAKAKAQAAIAILDKAIAEAQAEAQAGKDLIMKPIEEIK